MRLADDVLARAALGAHDRLGEALAREAPVGDDAEAAQAEQVCAARTLRVDLVAEAPSAAAQQQAAEPCRARRAIRRVADRRR